MPSRSAVAVWLNGRPDGGALALSRGLHYGDGVFRTCLIYFGQVIDIKEQIEKLHSDARRLGIDGGSVAELRREALAAARGRSRAVLKLLLLRAGSERGYRTTAAVADRLVCVFPAPVYAAASWQAGITLYRTAFRLAPQPRLAGIKHLNRLEQVVASANWRAGADEGLVEDEQGRPLSGTRSNLFWVAGGVIRTPALDRCGVAGRMRERVIEAARDLGHRCRVAPGSWRDLQRAEEVFVTNSLVGVWPVRALGAKRWRAPGPLTRRLMDHLDHPRLVA